jgi:hypothetical protein
MREVGDQVKKKMGGLILFQEITDHIHIGIYPEIHRGYSPLPETVLYKQDGDFMELSLGAKDQVFAVGHNFFSLDE